MKSLPLPNLLIIHEHLDLRPAIGDAWRLLVGYPRSVSEEELIHLDIEVTQDDSLPLSIYKYRTYRTDLVIMQVFTATHTYLGGGEYHAYTTSEPLVTEQEMLELNHIGNF